jgi:formylglycine-generating enzyme required for sulfatase activity
MADIFISYKREEQPIAKKLADALQKKGWTVWWDPEVLTGERFHDIIDKELKKSKCVVVLWSKLSVESQNVKDEANYALKRNKLVPIMIEDVDLPYWFESINTGQFIDWDGSDKFPGYQKLVSDITKIIAEEDKRRRKEVEQRKAEDERKRKEAEAKPKADGERKRKEEKAEIIPDKTEPAKAKPFAPKYPEPRKTSKVLKYGAVACAIVLLIVGILWWFSQQKEKEFRLELERFQSESSELEREVIKPDNTPQRGTELYSQKNELNRQINALKQSVADTKMLPKLEKIRNSLDELRIKVINSIGMKFVLIPAGSFTMGSRLSSAGIARKYGGKAEYYNDEQPPHQVEITKPFYLQTTEVSQAQWKKVMGDNPSHFKDCGDDCPVERVSWDDAQKFIKKLNQMEGINKYRLPTEAEWEYACRAGTTTVFSFGNEVDKLGEYGWYGDNSGGKTKPVGKRRPNAWGLYDMHGNVYEWCQDWYGDYPTGPIPDPKGPAKGKGRVLRGGSWYSDAGFLRSASRSWDDPDFRYNYNGFRVARDI